MPRNNKSSQSRSRSRSPKGKRYKKSSSESDSSIHKKHNKYEKKQKDYFSKNTLNLKSRSDFKNHFIYEDVKIKHRKDEDHIMEQVKNLLKEQFGPIEHVTKINQEDTSFSFAVGFKYDKDAVRFSTEGGFINNSDRTSKMIAKPSPLFEYCLPLLKDLIKDTKNSLKRTKSPDSRKYKRSDSSDYDYKKKRERDGNRQRRERYSPQRRSHDKKQNKRQYKIDQKSIWMFGLPWSIKGKEVQTYLADHTSGPFPIIRWQWVRVKNSNCEFMEIILEQKKANKLLSLRQQQEVEGCPCIITAASQTLSQDNIKETLREYQFKVSFPDKINPSALYKALNDNARVVQIVSCQKLVEGRSDSFIITLASSSKAKDVKRLGLLATGIKVEEMKGQLVFRPTKHSKLIENEN